MTVKYIIGHWTAGAYSPCIDDLKSYQLLIDGNGKLHNGKLQGQTASTGGMNSITYNISCCGGLSQTPVKPKQIEAFYKACAIKIKGLGLNIDKFYTHAEIGEMVRNYQNKKAGESHINADCNGKLITDLLPWNDYLKQNIGKIDLRTLPDIKGSAKQTGDFIRGKIKWYLERTAAEGDSDLVNNKEACPLNARSKKRTAVEAGGGVMNPGVMPLNARSKKGV